MSFFVIFCMLFVFDISSSSEMSHWWYTTTGLKHVLFFIRQKHLYSVWRKTVLLKNVFVQQVLTITVRGIRISIMYFGIRYCYSCLWSCIWTKFINLLMIIHTHSYRMLQSNLFSCWENIDIVNFVYLLRPSLRNR